MTMSETLLDSDLIFKAPFEIFGDESKLILKKPNNELFSLDSSLGFDSLKKYEKNFLDNHKGVKAYSIVGIAEAKINKYLIAATKTKFVGKILNSNIFKIEEFSYFPLKTKLHFKFSDKDKDIPNQDKIYIQMLEDFLNRNNLFYSDSMDLTTNVQKTFKRFEREKPDTLDTVKNSSNIYLNCNKNYFWNNHLLTNVIQQKLHEEARYFFHPIINGFVMIRTISNYVHEFNYVIISRKELKRSGMRFMVRGIDKNGNVANFVETEQIIISKRNNEDKVDFVSYLQIRGSIPLFWTQAPNMELNPTILFDNENRENYFSFEKHAQNITRDYDGKIVYINLIDRKGDQNNIGEYLNTLHKEYKDSRTKEQLPTSSDLVWFDFHHECRKMKYENISNLLKRPTVSNGLKNIGYTHYEIGNYSNFSFGQSFKDEIFPTGYSLNLVKIQQGAFRTNCIDCLDRTNVVQTVISRINLHHILREIGLSKQQNDNINEPFEPFQDDFEITFRGMWTDNGNLISKAYSGTDALKADFTKTGKRTKLGALADGINSCKRFYVNNFRDGHNQDSHDYFLGNLNANKQDMREHSIFAPFILVSFIFFISLILYSSAASISLPLNYEENLRKKIFKFILFSAIIVLTSRISLKYFKKSIIDRPTNDQ